MAELAGRGAAWRWLLPLLVVLLGLGHVCELQAFVDLGDHHATTSEGHPDELLSACDPALATSSPAPGQTWTALDVSRDLPVVEVAPVLASPRSEAAARIVDRPPLFLLHASLLI